MRPRLSGLLFIAFAAGALVSCEGTGPSNGARSLTRVDPSWVVGDAASRLQANGRFDLAFLVAPEGGDLSEPAARNLATAFVRLLATSAGNLREQIEQEHGSPLDFTALVPCTRVLWQRSPWMMPFDEGPHYLRNTAGNHYWFQFCTPSGVPALFQLVAAQSGVTVALDGQLTIPAGSGGDFATFGIPLTGEWELSPEVAVEALVQAMPRKVREIGEFTGCPYSNTPCTGGAGYVWHLLIDRPIRVRRRSDQVELDVSDFYVEASRTTTPLAIMVAEATQPADQWFVGPVSGGTDSVRLVRRGPVRFSAIDIISQ